MLVLPDPVLARHVATIAQRAAADRLPAASGFRQWADAGFLATYGPKFEEGYRRAATYVDRILKGARPADLPIEQSANFELVVNAKTAKALGVTIPRSVRERADQVIR